MNLSMWAKWKIRTKFRPVWLKYENSLSSLLLVRVFQYDLHQQYELLTACWKLKFSAAKSLQSCPTLCDPIDGNPPGSPVPGIQPAKLDPTPGPLDLRFPLPGMLLLLICPLLQFSAQSSILTDNLTLQPYIKYHPPPPLFSCLNFFFFMALIY